MNNTHLSTTTEKNTTARKMGRRTWAALIVLTVGAMLPMAAQAEAPSSGVPFVKALADAKQVVAMNSDWKVFQVKGDSMEPEFGASSLLLASVTGYQNLQTGMVVVYRDGSGDLVAHKLVAATAGGWMVKGLNNDRADPGLVTAENLRGVVFGVLHYNPETVKLAAVESSAQPQVALAKRY